MYGSLNSADVFASRQYDLVSTAGCGLDFSGARCKVYNILIQHFTRVIKSESKKILIKLYKITVQTISILDYKKVNIYKLFWDQSPNCILDDILEPL